jgi:hypothetical protein
MEAADNGFHIPDTFNFSGKLGGRTIGKRNYMKSISDTEKFAEERPRGKFEKFPEIAAHAGGSVNKDNKVDRSIRTWVAAALLLAVGKQQSQQRKQDKVRYFFHNGLFLLLIKRKPW